MTRIALYMLLGERAKYLGLVFGIAFSTFLMAQQVSIFIGVMARTANQIYDVLEPDIWVMDPRVAYFDEVEPLTDIQLPLVRGVHGVEWAAPFYRGNAVMRTADGQAQQVTILGIDGSSLIGGPRKMVQGNIQDLRLPESMILDEAGYRFVWPGQPFTLPREVEINDFRLNVLGIADARPPFLTFPIVYVSYEMAMRMAPPQRKLMSYVLVKAADGHSPEEVAARIQERTGLKALVWREFAWRSIQHYLTRTGIPVNFGITVALGFLVGAVIAAQTFYLFVVENMRQFGSLKAIGVTNMQILGMVLVQALTVGLIGYGVGIGLCAMFFFLTRDVTALKGFMLYWQVMAGTGVAVVAIMLLAAVVSIRRVFVIDPAIVFRG